MQNAPNLPVPPRAPSGSTTPAPAWTPEPEPESGNAAPAAVVPAAGSPLEPEAVAGKTVISETAVAKVAAIAARTVPGVYALGSGTGRAIGAVRGAVGGSSGTQGVHVEVGEREVAVDVTVVALYGTPLMGIANAVRAAVYSAVEELVGLHVVEVNVDINDVQIPGAETKKDQPRTSAS